MHYKFCANSFSATSCLANQGILVTEYRSYMRAHVLQQLIFCDVITCTLLHHVDAVVIAIITVEQHHC
jgi:hypothetical protein